MQYSQAVSVSPIAGSSQIDLNASRDASDAALVEAIAAGDKNALQVLYRRHHVKIYRFALRFIRDEATAEDVVSEVFIDVWRQAGRFECRSQVSTWLLAITRNKALSMLRRRAETSLDEEVAEFIEDAADNPEVTMQKQERSAILRSCLEQLSPAHREIIDLVYYHEKSIDEVAEVIGVPANTVKTRMFYARKRIGEMMAAQGLERATI
jgi:RNA polymerase sigma-70 factor (ECF subfamily)